MLVAVHCHHHTPSPCCYRGPQPARLGVPLPVPPPAPAACPSLDIINPNRCSAVQWVWLIFTHMGLGCALQSRCSQGDPGPMGCCRPRSPGSRPPHHLHPPWFRVCSPGHWLSGQDRAPWMGIPLEWVAVGGDSGNIDPIGVVGAGSSHPVCCCHPLARWPRSCDHPATVGPKVTASPQWDNTRWQLRVPGRSRGRALLG